MSDDRNVTVMCDHNNAVMCVEMMRSPAGGGSCKGRDCGVAMAENNELLEKIAGIASLREQKGFMTVFLCIEGIKGKHSGGFKGAGDVVICEGWEVTGAYE